ncbi:uncharacterized protein [Temnothorax nylanderi]|uniref:uncharacterized protein n=1 Tax=Temnothorax nylanderi TaxID=102681 RepID=UPI003A84F6DE
MKVISSKRKISNHEYCCVYGCKSRASNNREISFHKFPEKGKCTVEVTNKFGTIEKVDKRKAWIMATRTGEAVTSRMKVCSLHFSASDYVFSELEYERPRLKKSAVPTLQLPMQKIVSTASKARAERVAKREAKKANKKEKEETVKDTDEAVAIDINEVGVDSAGNNETLLIADEEKTKVRDIDIQTDFYSSYYNQIKSDRELSTATGITNFEIFHVIVSNVKKLYNNAKSKLSVEEKVMLTFIKLKQNISFAFLATLFNCYSVRTCQRIFVNMIRVLRACFDSCIHWPSKQEILRNIPNCFLPFPDIRIILDCTEILLQKPKSVCCQAITYSNYKSNYTLKFMTGVTPAGTISFVSRCYGGRFSDKAILNKATCLVC